MADRTITGILYRPRATVLWNGGQIIFELLTRFSLPGGIVLCYEVPVTAGLDASFSVILRVPDSGMAQYKAHFPAGDTLTFWLGAGASISIDALLNGAGEVPGNPTTVTDLINEQLIEEHADVDITGRANNSVLVWSTGDSAYKSESYIRAGEYYSTIPAEAVVVDQGGSGDYSTVREALAAITDATSSNKRTIVVRGLITDSSLLPLSPKSDIDVAFLPGSDLHLINTAGSGHGVHFVNINNAHWYAVEKRRAKIRFTATTGSTRVVLKITNAVNGQFVTVSGLDFVNLSTAIVRAYGVECDHAVLFDCDFYANGYDRGYGAKWGAQTDAYRCRGFGTNYGKPDASATGGACYLPVGILIDNPHYGRLHDCEGYGGHAGTSAEAYGIWGYSTVDTLSEVINCKGYGGIGVSNSSGIYAHRSGTGIRWIDATGISGTTTPGTTYSAGSHGLLVPSEGSISHRHEFIGGMFMSIETLAANPATPQNTPSGAWMNSFVTHLFSRATFMGSRFVKSYGVFADILMPVTEDSGYAARFSLCDLVGGGGSTSYYRGTEPELAIADSHALYITRLTLDHPAGPANFDGSNYYSNSLSSPIFVDTPAFTSLLQFNGGVARSMNPSANPAFKIPVAATWNNAEIHNMRARGGFAAGIIPVTPTMVGSNVV